MGAQRSSIVTTDFVDTGAERSRTVVLTSDNIRIGLETTLEVGAYGGNKDYEEIFVGGFHTHGDASTDQERTEVEACTGAVRRNEALIELDDLLAHFDKFFGGELRHHDATAGALQTLGVGFGAEDTNLAVFAAISLETFESLLAIVQAGCSHVHFDMLRGGNFNLTPLTVAIVAANVIVGFYITERKVLPINIHDI